MAQLNAERLAGRRVLVTGAGSGIGLAIAARLVAEGAAVIALDKDAEAAQRAVDELGLHSFVEADVTSLDAVTNAVDTAAERLGGLDGLVNNAGIEILGGIDVLTEEQWDLQFAVNVKGVFTTSKAVLPHLLEGGGGAIVNTASDVGLTGERGIDAYVASKHAVVGLTRSLALTWGPRGVRTNAVCPGTTATPLTERHLAAGTEAERQRVTAPIPMARLADPSEIASAVGFLLSADAGYVNGAMLSVDGGASAGYYFEMPEAAR